MIVVYHDIGGAHSTSIAANIHINRLPVDRIPTKGELQQLQTFDKIEKDQLGHLIFIGNDEFGSKIYTLGCKYSAKLVLPAIKDMFDINNTNNEQLTVIDTLPTVNFWMKLGGFTSRQLRLVFIGRPIVTYGSQLAYKNIVQLVNQVKNNLFLKSKNQNL